MPAHGLMVAATSRAGTTAVLFCPLLQAFSLALVVATRFASLWDCKLKLHLVSPLAFLASFSEQLYVLYGKFITVVLTTYGLYEGRFLISARN